MWHTSCCYPGVSEERRGDEDLFGLLELSCPRLNEISSGSASRTSCSTVHVPVTVALRPVEEEEDWTCETCVHVYN